MSSFYDKFLCFWKGPGWIAGTHNPEKEYEIPPCTRSSVIKYHTKLTTPWKLYLVVLFLYATLGSQIAYIGLSSEENEIYWYSIIGSLYFGLTLFCMGLTW